MPVCGAWHSQAVWDVKKGVSVRVSHVARVFSSEGTAVQAERPEGFGRFVGIYIYMSMAAQEVAAETMAACKDPLVKKQLA